MASDRNADFKSGIIQSLLAETRDVSVALASFASDLKSLRETVILLSKILKDGNGQASLMTRFSLLERTVLDLDVKNSSNKAAIDKIDQEARMDKREESKSRWVFYGTMIPGILALAGSILALALR